MPSLCFVARYALGPAVCRAKLSTTTQHLSEEKRKGVNLISTSRFIRFICMAQTISTLGRYAVALKLSTSYFLPTVRSAGAIEDKNSLY